MAPSWAIPTGTLLGIFAIGFIFSVWFFRYAWNKGQKKDMEAFAEGTEGLGGMTREERAQANRAIIERFERKCARERGEPVHEDMELPAYPAPAYKDASTTAPERRGGDV